MQFSTDDIKDMRAFYERELASTIDRLKHIESVLQKIGGSSLQLTINVGGKKEASAITGKVAASSTKSVAKASPKKRGRKPGKRGPKSIWGKLVLDTLARVQKPLTYDEMVQEAITFSNVPKEREKNVRQSIINVTFKMRTSDETIDTFSKGSRIKYLALKEWFDANGKILPEFEKKASNVKPKKRSTKTAVKTKTAPKAKAKIAAKASNKSATPKATVKSAAAGATKSTAKKASPKKVAVKKAATKKPASSAKKAAAKTAAPKASKPAVKASTKPAVKSAAKPSTAKKTATKAARPKATVAAKAPAVTKASDKATPAKTTKVSKPRVIKSKKTSTPVGSTVKVVKAGSEDKGNA